MAHPWYETAPLPPALRAQIADRYARFAGWRMDGADSGGDGGGGDAGGEGGAGGDAGAGGDGAGVDLSTLTVEQLREHPEFQTELNRVINDRLTREKTAWQKKLDDVAAAANLTAEQKAEAEKQQAAEALAAAQAKASQAFQLLASTQAQVAAVQAGGRPDRASAIAAQADLANAVDAEGNIDAAAVKAAVTAVLRDFPEWKQNGTGGQQQVVTPAASGGELGGTPQAPTFTKTMMEQMSDAERLRRWPEIEKAMTEGRFDYAR